MRNFILLTLGIAILLASASYADQYIYAIQGVAQIPQGGTAAGTASQARANLGILSGQQVVDLINTIPVASGAMGATGPQGLQGIPGVAGATGPQGIQGIQGIQGEQGLMGPIGPIGPAGDKGEIGQAFQPDEYGNLTEAKITAIETLAPTATDVYIFVVNPDGDDRVATDTPAGIAGDMARHIIAYDTSNGWRDFGIFTGVKGDTGATGPAGPAGADGATGATGSTGLQGPQGIQGIQGPIGATGTQGIQGIQGPQGLTGNVGPAGPAGPAGVQGIQGPVGPQGIQGIQGPSGSPGITTATLDLYAASQTATLTAHINNTTTAHGAVTTATANRLVIRDGSGSFSAATVTANLNGTSATSTTTLKIRTAAPTSPTNGDLWME